MQVSARARLFGIGCRHAQQLQHGLANVQSSSLVHSSTNWQTPSASGAATRDGGGGKTQFSGPQLTGLCVSQRLSSAPSVTF
jgi:hypothetical protein